MVSVLPTNPRPGETKYVSGRFWTYSKKEWDPKLPYKLGVPFRGGDEWGRRTLVVGLWFIGYVVWAWRTCWCQECHEVREHSYRMAYASRWEAELRNLLKYLSATKTRG